MNTKLTLSLDQTIIEEIKNFAKDQGVSISKMVDEYFRSIIQTRPTKSVEISPLVKKLTGVIDLPSNYDHKREYRKHIIKKYS